MLTFIFPFVGCPTRIFSDGGPQLVPQETQQPLQHWGVRHRLTTAEYPQSNGESAVRQLKRLFQAGGGRWSCVRRLLRRFTRAKNTPTIGGKSPAEIVCCHPIRSRVPTHYHLMRNGSSLWMNTTDAQWRRSTERFKSMIPILNQSLR
ncbi:hypothetical protein SNE40_007724 [Patella caerulea]|uniref:Integrase catalytic domain-containing protein n=1 Tax=Patella caerulea TaxID=87958 RepID=A0AAN8JXE0_PATCE